MSASLIDANVLLDIATADATWMAWSQEQLRLAARRGAIFINPIIYAELAPAFAGAQELDRWLDPVLFQRAARSLHAHGRSGSRDSMIEKRSPAERKSVPIGR